MNRRGWRLLTLAFAATVACEPRVGTPSCGEERPCATRAWRLQFDAPLGSDLVDLSLTVTPDRRTLAAGTVALGPLATDVVVYHERSEAGAELRRPGASMGGRHASPRVASSRDGPVVAWTAFEGTRGSIVAARMDGSGGWSDPPIGGGALSFPPHADDAQLVAGAGGELVLHWVQKTSFEHIGVAAGLLTPHGFEGPSSADDVVSEPKLFVNHPRSAANTAGDVILSWYQSVGGPLGVFVAEMAAGDRELVRREAPLSPSPAGPEGLDGLYLEDPQPAIHDDGSALIAWVQPDGAGHRALFLASRSGSGKWHTPATLAESASAFEGVACCPAVAFAPGGDAYVAWKRSSVTSNSILVAHRASDGSWVAPPHAPVELDRATEVGAPKLAITEDGHVVATWQSKSSLGSRVIVRESRVDRDGDEASRWDAPVTLSRAGAIVDRPQVAATGTCVVVGWISDGGLDLAKLE